MQLKPRILRVINIIENLRKLDYLELLTLSNSLLFPFFNHFSAEPENFRKVISKAINLVLSLNS